MDKGGQGRQHPRCGHAQGVVMPLVALLWPSLVEVLCADMPWSVVVWVARFSARRQYIKVSLGHSRGNKPWNIPPPPPIKGSPSPYHPHITWYTTQERREGELHSYPSSSYVVGSEWGKEGDGEVPRLSATSNSVPMATSTLNGGVSGMLAPSRLYLGRSSTT
jgi:hypothetical protein